MRVLVAGGGFAGAEAVLALRDLAGDRVEIELLSTTDALEFRPHAVRAPFGLGEAERIPLGPLCSAHDTTLRIARATALDIRRNELQTDRFGVLGYDLLLLAMGARRLAAVPGAITFDGARGVSEVRHLLERACAGEVRRIAFVVPDGVAWTLPLYELALLTEAYLRERGASTPLHVVTPEPEPLAAFGAPAGERIRKALAARGIALHRPERLRGLGADAVVALPRLVGPDLRGLRSRTVHGFIRVDWFGQVHGTASVYAAGDATDFPVKQGGLATQQAEAAAAHMAARAGAPIDPQPFSPDLHALLLTGAVPVYLRGEPRPEATSRPQWPAGGKVIGNRLSRWLGVDDPGDRPQGIELALTLADEEADEGNAGSALGWLSAAEAIAGDLTPEYEAKRRAWTLGSDHTPEQGPRVLSP